MMHKLTKPEKLKAGDKIAAVTLSWGGAAAFPYRYEVGKKRLEDIFNLSVQPTKHALKDPTWIYNNPQARADDLMEAFIDPEIRAIFSIIGGEDSIRILPFLNYDIIRNNPKIFMGHSDSTVIHFACLKAGLASLYGPCIMTAFAENISMHQYTIQGIQRTIFSNEKIGIIPQCYEGWTNQFLDWNTPTNQEIRRVINPPLKWQFLGDQTKIQGHLIGGCVEVLQFINGTDIWPSKEAWKDAILFLETSEEFMSPVAFERMLRNLGAQSILKFIKGLIFSKPGSYDLNSKHFDDYSNSIMKILKEFDAENIPVVTYMDFGHTDPLWTIPYGCLAEIDGINKQVSILENAVI